jgi:hypothetical protein
MFLGPGSPIRGVKGVAWIQSRCFLKGIGTGNGEMIGSKEGRVRFESECGEYVGMAMDLQGRSICYMGQVRNQ